MTYRALRRLVHQDDRHLLKDRVEAALRDHKGFEIEIRLFSLDGELRWVRLSGQPLHDGHGRPARVHGAIMEVTQRKRGELRQAMEHGVTHLLSEAQSPAAVMPDIIETICGAIGWSGGAAWLLRDPGHPQRCTASWAIAGSRCERYLARHAESGNATIAGRILRRLRRSGEPLWVADLFHDADTRSDLTARTAGLHALLAFPIESGGEFMGAILLFAPHPQALDHDLLASVHCIGRHIGQFFRRQHTEAALRQSEAHFRALVEQASDSFFVHDAHGRLLNVNQRACDALGYTREELLAMRLFDIDLDITPERLEPLLGTVWAGTPAAIESRHQARDGTIFPVELRIGSIDMNGQRHLPSLVRDVTERKQLRDHIQYLAYHDPVTGLPNRVMFNRVLEHALQRAASNRSGLAVLFIDLDRFKNINDTLGHHAGDRLLQEIARRLQGVLQGQELVARLGGDEFVVLLDREKEASRANHVARHILDTVVREYRLEGQPVHVTASIGISLYPDDGTDAFSLMKHADVAMYRAKAAGKNTFQFYAAHGDSYPAGRLALESDLRRGIARDELVLHYQPKVDTVSGHICGVEVLVRWQHPELGLLQPKDFIGLAEESGLIVPLTRWVLQQACRQNAGWRAAGLPDIRMAVNLSAREFEAAHLHAELVEVLRETAMPPSLLELEITESMMMQNAAQGVETLARLKVLGIHVALDDFGVGYSSLSHLKHLPVDVLKIDRSFLIGVPGAVAEEAIAKAIVAMAKSLGMQVVAEGVETAEQLAFLRAHGCDEAQGFYFSPPLPAEEFVALLQENRDGFDERLLNGNRLS